MKATKPNSNSRPALFWMSEVAGRAKLYIGILLAVQAVLGISGVFYAMLLRRIVNAAVAGERGDFAAAAAMFVSLVVLQIALRALNRFLEEFTRSTLENRFKGRLFDALLTRDYSSVTRVHSGEWMNRMTSDTVIVADGLVQILPGVSGMAVKMTGALLAILWLEPVFLYFLVPGGIALFFLTYIFRKVLKRLHRRIQEADGRLRVFLTERLGSLMIVRTFAQERQTAKKAAELMEDHKVSRMKRNHFSNICNIGFGAAMNGVYVLGAVFGGYGILTGGMSYGDLLAILQLIGQIQNPFANITGYLPKYYAMLASAERLAEAERFADDHAGVLTEQEVREFYQNRFEGLELKDVSFTYQAPAQSEELTEMPMVLKGLNLEIRKGEYVAFTGPSGCGKSTVLKLLMCLYPLEEGERCLLEKEQRRPLTSAYRGLFAYVPQGNQLLSGTIREIIAFGDDQKMRREEELQRALAIACADGFVSELEQGMDTLLGERGAGLSEGQMQRIAIARAVFSDHPILLLDEATSSLDAAAEAEVLGNLRAMTDKTVIIVTHRAAVLQICDKRIDFGKMEGTL